MKTRVCHGLTAAILTVLCILAGAFSSSASINGALDPLDGSVISGWAMDTENPDKSVSVVLFVYTDGTTESNELAKVTADQYRNDLTNTAANGNHAFSCRVDWDKMKGESFMIEAYAETGHGRERLYGSLRYTKRKTVVTNPHATGPAGESGPTSGKEQEGTRGALLGTFETTAYCSCEICCPNGKSLTYSETVPRAGHTISADIEHFPIGTRLMIGDIIYTVEDVGSNISGNRLDIYCETHEEAVNYGVQEVEVYAVE